MRLKVGVSTIEDQCERFGCEYILHDPDTLAHHHDSHSDAETQHHLINEHLFPSFFITYLCTDRKM